MSNIGFDFLGRTLIGVVLYCVVMIVSAMVFLPLCILWTVLAIVFIIKEL